MAGIPVRARHGELDPGVVALEAGAPNDRAWLDPSPVFAHWGSVFNRRDPRRAFNARSDCIAHLDANERGSMSEDQPLHATPDRCSYRGDAVGVEPEDLSVERVSDRWDLARSPAGQHGVVTRVRGLDRDLDTRRAGADHEHVTRQLRGVAVLSRMQLAYVPPDVGRERRNIGALIARGNHDVLGNKGSGSRLQCVRL